MKNFLLSLAIVAGLSVSTLQAQNYGQPGVINATLATAALALVSDTTNHVPMLVQSVQLTSGSSVGATVTFYDSNTGTNVYSQPAYQGISVGTSNLVTSFVGLNGITNNMTNTVLYSQVVTNAAVGNQALPVVAAFVVPANNTAVYAPPGGLDILHGITANSSSSNITVTIYYQKLR